MINLFELASNDRSIEYLFQIFGSMGGVLSSGNAALSGVSITIIGSMFNTFNATILAVGALILVYVTVMGVMKTAHEGEMMGKQWSSLWVPLRMVMGIAALVPTGSGYSAIQIIMMWVIVQGIGAADVLWGTVLKYIEAAGSTTAQLTIPSVGIDGNIRKLYQGLVCQATFKESLPNPSGFLEGSYYCSISGDAFCRSSVAFNPDDQATSVYKLGPGGACGVLHYCFYPADCIDPNSLKCKSCQAQREALGNIINGTLIPLANQFQKTDYSYRNFYSNNDPSAGGTFSGDWIYTYCSEKGIPRSQCCVPGSGTGDNACKATSNPFDGYPTYKAGNPQEPSDEAVQELYLPYSIAALTETTSGDFIQTNTSYYLNTIGQAVNDYISQQGASGDISAKTQKGKILQYAQRTGWIMAGTLYYLIGQQNSNNLKNAVPLLQFDPDTNLTTGSYRHFRQNYAAAGILLAEASGAGSQGAGAGAGGRSRSGGSAGPSELGEGQKAVSEAVDGASKAFTDSVFSGQTKQNPLVALQAAGYTMLFIAGILFLVFIIVSFILGILGNLSVFVLGTGVTNPIGGAAVLVYMVFVPLVFGLLAILIGVGGLLGVYVPLIPYVIFTLGVIGWFMSVIEAMVAGPLVALGILMPGGQHEIMGKAEPALMLLFSLFLRPALMIFGLVASMLLAIVVVSMINSGFGLVITSIASQGSTTGIAFDGAGNPYVQGGAAALAFNPLQLILFLCAYVMLIVTALNKCFTAIHVIPEKVMRWIGGQGEQYGEAEGMREVKGGVESGEHGAKGAGETVKGKGEGLGREQMYQKKEEAGKAEAKLKSDEQAKS